VTGQVVFLHVGAPKTGTTYVQDLLFRNRERLAQEGLLYAADRFDDYFMAALDLLELEWGGLGSEAVGAWDRLVERVHNWPGTVVISHEILASASPEQVERAQRDLAPAEVHIIYSARDLGRQFPAEWQETVKHQRSNSFATFIAEEMADYEAGGSDWFWTVQSWPEVLRRWGHPVTPSHVHLVTVPRSGGRHDLLWDRFRSLLGIKPEWCTIPSDRTNPSLGAAETTVLRRINRRVRGKLSNADYRYLVREQLAHLTMAKRGAVGRATLPPSLEAWTREVTATWLTQLRDADYDVRGDLEELQPARSADQDGWLDPDAPDPARSVDVALDCIETLLFEAARIDGERLRAEFERDQASHELAAAEQHARDGAAELRAQLETPGREQLKRSVVQLGREHRSVEVALNSYRRLRRSRVPAEDSDAVGGSAGVGVGGAARGGFGGPVGEPFDERQDRFDGDAEHG
jgi:hypothetical protein